MIRLFLLIRDLHYGGAQRQLTELVKGIDKTRFTTTVAAFYDGGALQAQLEGLPNVHVVSLQKQGRWDVLPFLLRLGKLFRAARPQIIYGFMDASNMLGLLLGRASGAKVVWGVRSSNMVFNRSEKLTYLLFRLCAWCSRFVDLIIVNSVAGREHRSSHGFSRRRMNVIHNGIDIERFRPDREAGRALRRAWNVQEYHQLIGVVGRLDPMKDHKTFLQAAKQLAHERPDVRFVCIGDGPDEYKDDLRQYAEQLGLGDRLVWAGAADDMPAYYNALDISTSSSAYGEGFANVIGEAMACGVPCVVTDVGDSAIVVGATGQVTPPGDPQALASAWKRVLDLPREERRLLAQRSRERIVRLFSLQQLVRSTETMLLRTLSQ